MVTIDAERMMEFNVMGRDGDEIGDVNAIWVDEETRRPEFIGVKTGMVFGKNHVVPLRDADIDTDEGAIRLPYAKDRLEDAPAFDAEHDLSEDEEAQVYEYYGVGGRPDMERTGRMGGEERLGEPREDVEMATAEEELEVGKRTVSAGGLRLKKIVNTEHEEVPVDLKREEIHIERLSPRELERAETDMNEDELVMRAEREEPVVGKETHVTGGVRAYKTTETERRNVEGDVRREDIEVDREGEMERGEMRRRDRE